jgi:DNA repair protein RadC
MSNDGLFWNESPVARLRERGAQALSLVELLAIVAGGTKPKDLENLRHVVRGAGSIRDVVYGQGGQALPMAKRARISAALELARRCLFEELQESQALTSPRDSAQYLKARIGHLPYEVFACLFLDNRHRVLGFSELFRGTIDGASVHPREVVRECIMSNAAAVILAHNHPSGVAEPSAADRAITRELRDALALIGVRILDHFVIGSGEPASMAARGMI